MASLPVVKAVDLLEDVGAGQRMCEPDRVMHELDLDRREEAPGYGVAQQLRRRLMLQTRPWSARTAS
jgi:hypothetical protein